MNDQVPNCLITKTHQIIAAVSLNNRKHQPDVYISVWEPINTKTKHNKMNCWDWQNKNSQFYVIK